MDGTNERGLLTRFQLRQLHGVFHINGTQTRQYCEGRACEGARLSTQQVRPSRAELGRAPGAAAGTSSGSGARACSRSCAAGVPILLPARLQLVRFATEGWKAEEPRTGCTSPVSRCGKAVGSLTK